jgi:hypothetical protein
MGKRPRIQPITLDAIAADELQFTKNKCSDNARKHSSLVECVEFDVWHDKHYHNREQHGDDDGKRLGIENDVVNDLIKNSTKHLLYYSLKVKHFSFVNFDPVGRPERIVISQKNDSTPDLNIIVEYHYLSISKYEVTVRTAMCKNGFKYGDGQYKIEINQDDSSTLYRNERGQIKTICYFEP